MQSKTMHGAAEAAEVECRRMDQDLNDGSLGQRQNFCERYLADLASHRRPRTVDDYKGVLEALTTDYHPARPDELTPHRLREFVRGRTEKCSPATRNKLIRTLRAIFSWAVPEYVKENPAKRVKFAKAPEKDRRTLTPAELVKVLSAADARGQAVLLLGSCCGLRREEIGVRTL
jgi:integrase